MYMHRVARFLLICLVVSIVPASLSAQLLISINVNFAPPMLPVYEQPICPEPNLMWTPGYWAYDRDGGDYFWVPGAWVPAPYEGAMWTPPYWGWSDGMYAFHDGYWGNSVGYYGGVNYGFGFGGIGFAGGEWRGHDFAYNTAVVHVNETVIHTTYVNQTVVQAGIVANPNHIAYNGGPSGIQHTATPAEQTASSQPHVAPTTVQTQHTATAESDKSSFSKANGGRPANVVTAKPLAEETHAAPAGSNAAARPAEKTAPAAEAQPRVAPTTAVPVAKPETEAPNVQRVQPEAPQRNSAPAQQAAPVPQAPPVQRAPVPQETSPQRETPAPAQQPAPQQRQAPPQQPVPQQREAQPAPQQHEAAPAPRAAPQERAAPAPQEHAAPAPNKEPEPRDR
jgi:hypothetical protein